MVYVATSLEIRGDSLHFDGVDVAQLAEQVPTPFFLFSARQIAANVDVLRTAFTRRHVATEIFYASKACSNMWFLDVVRRSGINIEVNAGGELTKALRAAFAPQQIVFNGVAKTVAEIELAVETGVRAIIVDSLFELERVAEVAARRRRRANVSLRIDVDVPTLTHPGLVTAHGGKAGIDRDDAPQAFARAAADGWIDLRGMHMHIGSQITSVEPYERAVETALDIIDAADETHGIELEHLNAGGGFAIAYRSAAVCQPADYFCSTLAADDYAEAICAVVERRKPRLKLFLEPGRSIAGTAAVLVTRVENEKTKGARDASGTRVGDEHWLTVDAGFNTLLEHTNYRWYYPAVVATRAGQPATTPFRLAGPLCDGGDVFAGDGDSPFRHFPEGTTVGDVIAFIDAGAYSLEMMNPYNARPRAAAYAVVGSDVRQIRAPETFEDMIMHDVLPGAAAGSRDHPASRWTEFP
jgi:diaminopimelate decarboxylase